MPRLPGEIGPNGPTGPVRTGRTAGVRVEQARFVPVGESVDATAQVLIRTTEQGLRLELSRVERLWRDRTEWVAPLGILAGAITGLVSGVKSTSAGYAVLWLFAGAAALWLGVTAVRAYRARGKNGQDLVIEALRRHDQTVRPTPPNPRT